MSSWVERIAAFCMAAGLCVAAQAAGYPGIGRDATPDEVKAWDIDVRPDFKGLPPGSGSVAKGQDVWESKCASCHGVFGEANSVFNPLVGGTTAEDIRTGRVAALRRNDYPGRTTLMKVPTVSTLWDYIHRAMPWNAPKSLTVDEVYAATAYLLNLADVVPSDFTLSDKNIAEVQQRMPNRNGMASAHAMWPGGGLPGSQPKPDVQGSNCMKDCPVEAKVTSLLPEFALGANGNLAEQNRLVGPQRGIDTRAPAARGAAPAAAASAAAAATAAAATVAVPAEVLALMQKSSCTSCHAADHRVVGPSWTEVAARHKGKADYLVGKIRSGGSGTWGAIPMPPQAGVDDATVRRIATWLAGAQP
ncbi:c-type cytochrome [Ramlibacter aquaticus]|uniref:C-type cytochrome n=2 Tax=Ramlibacter TaxID=174951 RepID=A0ABR9SLI8_9BURK|nr:c-type cytochrome [Ramlibacter aquaticus]